MPDIAYGAAAYRRSRGKLPELRLVNMFLEATPTADNGVVLLSRAGLLGSATVGIGPIEGVFWQDGVFAGDVFAVSGGKLYRAGRLLGTINGGGPVSFAASDLELLVTAGGSVYSYNGTDLVAVAFPDNARVAAVAFLGGLFIYVRAGSGKWYWSAVLNGRKVDALSFASAEFSPDSLLDAVVIGETLWLLGQTTIEPWALSGNPELPFSRIDQRLFRKGVAGTGCAWDLDNAMFWIGADRIVYRAADVAQRISDHGIEERLQSSSSVSAFVFVTEGHSFFCVRLDAATFAYDAATGQWCEFATFSRANFRARCAATNGARVLLGDDASGTLWELSGYQDAGAVLERRFTAAFPIKGGAVRVTRLNVEVAVGWTDLLAGQGSSPVIEMRCSDDAGATFGDWEAESLGAQGSYRAQPEWRALGMFDAPGFLAEFRVTDPVDLRLSAVRVNEPVGGRSR